MGEQAKDRNNLFRNTGHIDQKLLRVIRAQAKHPPGNDPVLGAFYTTIAQLNSQPESLITKTLEYVKKKRPSITNEHLVNLIYRAFQAIKFKVGDLSYAKNDTPEKWIKTLKETFSEQTNVSYFKKLLVTKSTTTTIYQRYIGPFSIIKYYFKKPVEIVDFGCGGNYALPGLEKNIPFKFVLNHTTKNLFMEFNNFFKKGLAIDIEDPNKPSISAWRKACSFYPKELGLIKEFEAFEEKIKFKSRVKFRTYNSIIQPEQPLPRYDAIILSTILYQLSYEEQGKMLSLAKKLIKRNGLMIVQDFAVKANSTGSKLKFIPNWGHKNPYRTFVVGNITNWKFWEVLQWTGGRCREAYPGEDFNRFFADEENAQRVSKPAFAQATS